MKAKLPDLLLRDLWDAVDDLDRMDQELVEWKVSERSITHKLAEHLRWHVDRRLHQEDDEKPLISVDCEYNRFGTEGKSKQYLWKRDLPDEEDGEYYTPNPDIVVHERGEQRSNLLAIEVKADSSRNPAAELLDLMKVVGYVGDPTFYQRGLYLDLTFTEGQVVPYAAWLLRTEQMEEDTNRKRKLWDKARELLIRSGKGKKTALITANKDIQKKAEALRDPFVQTFGFADLCPRSR
jgi:hypothetical protein